MMSVQLSRFRVFSRVYNKIQPCLSASSSSITIRQTINAHTKNTIKGNNHSYTRRFSDLASDKFDCDPSLVISILGPPNAGKSTLFNRLLCKQSNRIYRLSSEKEIRRPQRSRGRLGYKNQFSTHPRWGAIVSSTPGTTRDRRECIGRIGNIKFNLVDTAGVDADRIHLLNDSSNVLIPKKQLEKSMMEQTLEAAKMSDLIFVLFDGRVGITADVEEIIRWLRRIGCKPYDEDKGLRGSKQSIDHRNSNNEDNRKQRKVVLLANKLEGDSWNHSFEGLSSSSIIMDHLRSATRLGFGEAIPISAEHGEGLADIAVIIQNSLAEMKPSKNQDDGVTTSSTLNISNKPLQLAICGRQNVGKSTLINALLQRNRVICGPTPGLTRDAISIKWSWKGRAVQLIDTAGIRRIAQRDHSDSIEDMAVQEATRAIKIAEVVVLLLDAGAKFLSRQELSIADAVIREGRALVVVANKMDLLLCSEYSKDEFVAAVRKQLEQRYPMLRKTPVLAISALNNAGIEDLMPVVFTARDRWANVIGTGILNRWLSDVVKSKAPPIHDSGRKIHIKYILQTKGRPPTFLLFCNVRSLPASYVRYLIRNFQDTFQMFGMDVRMAVKESAKENPYLRGKNRKIGIGGTRLGVGGAKNRKKRFIEVLKSTGSRPKKGLSRRFSRQGKSRS